MSIPLKLYWDPQREDNFTTATAEGERDALAAGYTFIRMEGYTLPSSAPGTVPLKLYWSPQRGDNFTTATAEGEQAALAAGYQFIREEGYIYPSPQPGTVPLKLYWSPQRGDNFTTATAEGEQAALTVGYQFIREEGYVPVAPPNLDIALESDLGAGHFMSSQGILLENGHIDAVTRTYTVTLLGGFTGGVYLLLADANAITIGSTSIHTFGVDGRWIGRSDRVDYWAEDVPLDLARRARSLHTFHIWANDPLTNIRRFNEVVQEAIQGAQPIIALLASVKGLGGDGK